MTAAPASSPELSLASLAALQREVVRLRAERDQLERERDEYKQKSTWLLAQIERLRDAVPTPREKVDPRQIQLAFAPFVQELLDAVDPPPPPPGSEPRDPKRKRTVTPHGRRVLPEHLPIETLVLTPSPLPAEAVQIGTEISWRLGFRRASYYRLRVVRPIYVVPESAACSDVAATWAPDAASPPVIVPAPVSAEEPSALAPVDDGAWLAGDKKVVYAPAPDEMIPRGLPLPDLLASILVRKFCDHLPFHRLEGICAREGIALTRGTMSGWAEGAHHLARYVVEAMENEAKRTAQVIATDATGVLVQHAERCKKGHFWVYVADQDHVFYRYSERHTKDVPKGFFAGFHGTVLSDASSVYDALFGLPDSPGEANCWSHQRRYFYKALDSENKPDALVGIGFCNALFDVERACRGLPPSERLVVRHERAGPIVEALDRWRKAKADEANIADGSRLRKALNYLDNQWAGLTHFLHDAHVAIHNNDSERGLRRLVIGRTNWLFVGSDESAVWTCTMVSLVASAQLHHLDPERYLRDLFRVLPVWPKSRMLELSPKHWTATRARLDEAQLAMPLGPVTVPPRLTPSS